jgi:hypothetical protein
VDRDNLHILLLTSTHPLYNMNSLTHKGENTH